jgi:hypothetical protein
VLVPPVTPFTIQVTEVLEVFVTEGVNCCIWLTATVTVLGVTDTEMVGPDAVTVTVVVPDFVGSATLVALTVMVPEGTVPGAV